MSRDSTPGIGKVIQIDEAKIEQHLSRVVRGTVEEMLNALLEAEADRLVRASQHERTQDSCRERHSCRWREWPGRRDRTGRHERRDAIETSDRLS